MRRSAPRRERAVASRKFAFDERAHGVGAYVGSRRCGDASRICPSRRPSASDATAAEVARLKRDAKAAQQQSAQLEAKKTRAEKSLEEQLVVSRQAAEREARLESECFVRLGVP